VDNLRTTLERLHQNLKANTTTSTSAMTKEHSCPICEDREWLVEGDTARPCQCRKAKTLQRMLKSSGLTDELRSKTFSNYKAANPSQEQAYKVCYEYVKDYAGIKSTPNNGVGLTGPVGTGKTHLLAAISNNLFARGITVCFVCMPDLIAELRAAMSESNSALERKIELASTVDVAFLDDLGKEIVNAQASEWVQTQYFRFLNPVI
jgi:DNA replication protein DnaC